MQSNQIWCVKKGEPGYPKRLDNITGAPKQLYVRGSLPLERVPTVAIIGARDCSEYGKCVARMIGEDLGRAGIQVISGMARGIDGIGQEAALDCGGLSFGILGCGVDVCYPERNRRLYDKLVQRGGVISEYENNTPAIANHFPARNRIVSGLSDAIIVVEAREKSGTLITVDMALEQGKDVYAVPGRITDKLSDGCNRLIKLGAGIYTGRDEFIEELEENFFRKHGYDYCVDEKKEESVLSSGQNDEISGLYKQLDFTPKTVEEIVAGMRSDITFGDAVTELMEMCLLGKAVQISPGKFVVGPMLP